MTHSDKDVANFFHQNEIEITNVIVNLLQENGIIFEDLKERVHIIIF